MGKKIERADIEVFVSFANTGDRVELIPRIGDNPAPGGAVKKATVRKDGRVKFSGVPVGAYFVAGTVKVSVPLGGGRFEEAEQYRFEAVNAKADIPAGPLEAIQAQAAAQRANVAPPAGAFDDPAAVEPQHRGQTGREVISGMRHTGNSDPGRDKRGHVEPIDPLVHPEEARLTGTQGSVRAPEQPVSDVGVLESDTHAGSAFGAREPRLQQQDVPDDVVQESSTEAGDATPLGGSIPREVKASGLASGGEALTQQDELKGKVTQESATEEGEATPQPGQREAAEDRSVAAKKRAAKSRRQEAVAARKRSQASKKAAATRKRNAAAARKADQK